MSPLRNLLSGRRKRSWEDGNWGLSLLRVTVCRSQRLGEPVRIRRSLKVAMIGLSPTGLAAPGAASLPILEIRGITSKQNALPFPLRPAWLFGTPIVILLPEGRHYHREISGASISAAMPGATFWWARGSRNLIS